jgi:hypothetical protein
MNSLQRRWPRLLAPQTPPTSRRARRAAKSWNASEEHWQE